jgi:hypothetical protein
MTRSIFDPTGPDTERSGSRNLGPDAANLSHMPPDVTDGYVSEEEAAELEQAAGMPLGLVGANIQAGRSAQQKTNPDEPSGDPNDDFANPGQEADE